MWFSATFSSWSDGRLFWNINSRRSTMDFFGFVESAASIEKMMAPFSHQQSFFRCFFLFKSNLKSNGRFLAVCQWFDRVVGLLNRTFSTKGLSPRLTLIATSKYMKTKCQSEKILHLIDCSFDYYFLLLSNYITHLRSFWIRIAGSWYF